MRNNIRQMIGSNLREIRRRRSFTLEALAELLSDRTGEEYSGVSVGNWERGTRSLPVEVIPALCRILDCSADMLLIPGLTRDDSHFLKHLTPEMIDMLSALVRDWDGDPRALLHYCCMCAMCPKQERAEIWWAGISTFDRCCQSGSLIELPFPAPDPEYVADAWRRLYGKGQPKKQERE